MSALDFDWLGMDRSFVAQDEAPVLGKSWMATIVHAHQRPPRTAKARRVPKSKTTVAWDRVRREPRLLPTRYPRSLKPLSLVSREPDKPGCRSHLIRVLPLLVMWTWLKQHVDLLRTVDVYWIRGAC